jgi:hypothetical protein
MWFYRVSEPELEATKELQGMSEFQNIFLINSRIKRAVNYRLRLSPRIQSPKSKKLMKGTDAETTI